MLEDMGAGSAFHRVIGEIDSLPANNKVRRVILCSGKVYYDLLEERRKKEIEDVAILRVEQFYPWPKDLLTQELSKYPKAETVWCQEEPANMGGWTFVMRRIEYILDELGRGAKGDKRPTYVGRAASASPATGSLKTHTREQEHLVTQALTWETKDLQQPFHGFEE
jgi:2-oxoglutarate dehydrogenase E1 component